VTRVLIVDDEPANRALLRAYLANQGHELVEADSGQAALERAADAPPDLVLLDVLMPGLDGFEVCRRLRSAQTDGFLPIVLVSALTDPDSRRGGLEAGADEFLSKPVDRQELLLRARNLLALRELRRFRDEMMGAVVHDLRSPLGALRINLRSSIEDWGDDAALDALRDAEASVARLSELVGVLAEVHQLERAAPLRLESVAAGRYLEAIIAPRRIRGRDRGIAWELACDESIELAADPIHFRRAVEALFDHVLRNTAKQTVIGVRAVRDDARVRIAVTYTPTTCGHPGLALYLCRLALDAHGGRFEVRESVGGPTRFVLELPDPPEDAT
jgi:two-component system sensor histidine kinase/response regulator